MPNLNPNGFYFLGYTFKSGRKLRPSKESYKRLRIRARRLHEKGADHYQLLLIFCILMVSFFEYLFRFFLN